MVFESSLLDLGVVALLVPVFAEYAKIRARAERAFGYIAAAGVLFILAVVLQQMETLFAGMTQVALAVEVVGVIVAIFGAVIAAYKLVIE
ncbi:MAG: hypothetical protein DRP11_02090 [Candidatus Aenigmatarchaeota archaeon]|nr:MAG: hypothetical protein DRP11_02090 [Candidatus Aenigmarchaeota archaeon]